MVFNVIMEIQDKLKHLINPMVFSPYLRLCLIYTVYGGGFLVSKDLHSSTQIYHMIKRKLQNRSVILMIVWRQYTVLKTVPVHWNQ